MSNALAIAAVTATLRSLIEAGVEADPSISGVTVTTRPLDTARVSEATNQVNLFLYHTVINPTWRNMDIPRTVHPGSHDHTPLPLNLYYMMTAYHGNDEDGAVSNGRLQGSTRLLGLAMSALHDHGVLDAEAINANIPMLDQADYPFQQVERVRITPHPISIDEMSKLWSSFQTEYRTSVAYEVSVVLIESTRPRRAALPVLRRGTNDEGVFVVPISAPSLAEVQIPNRKAAAELGDLLTIIGGNLGAEGLTVQIHHLELDQPLTLIPEPDRTNQRLHLQLPDPAVDPTAPSTWAAGFCVLNATVQRPGLPPWRSNAIPFGLAPLITSRAPASAPAGNVSITVTCAPQIRDGQRVTLLVGEREFEPASVSTPANPTAETTLVFNTTALAAGNHPLRLRVEGVDSIPVDFSVDPPQFDANQVISVT
jgi:hypothetical protein